METITVTEATEEDIPFIAECRYDMFSAMEPEKDLRARREELIAGSRRYFQEHRADKDLVMLCARADGRPVGCGVILFQLRPPHVEHEWNLFGYVLNVFVLPEFRRRGIATGIMRALVAEAARRGVRRVGLHASAEGLPVYRRLGFEPKENYLENKL